MQIDALTLIVSYSANKPYTAGLFFKVMGEAGKSATMETGYVKTG